MTYDEYINYKAPCGYVEDMTPKQGAEYLEFLKILMKEKEQEELAIQKSERRKQIIKNVK